MAQLLKKFYSVYVFFEGGNLFTGSEPDEFNSNSHTISLRFFLILYCPLLPKKNFVFVTGSCRPYPVWLTTLANSWFNNSLATVFKESGLSVTPGIPRHISIARTHVIIFWHTGFTLSSLLPLRQWSLWGMRWGREDIVYNRFNVLYDVGSVAEETVQYHPLWIVNLRHDISRL